MKPLHRHIATTLVGMSAAGLLILSAPLAQAAPGGPGTPGGPRGDGALRPLVAAGTITRDQARTTHEAIKAACDASKATALSTLVSEGTISAAQATAISGAPRGLRTLVDSGVLTREQADAVRSEFQEYGGGDARSSALASLVANGTLTAAQADAISAALPERTPKS